MSRRRRPIVVTVAVVAAVALAGAGIAAYALAARSSGGGASDPQSPSSARSLVSSRPSVSPSGGAVLPAGALADYQLGGAYPPAADIGIVTRDRSAPAVSGVYSICYVNAFQTQPGEDATWSGANADLLLRDASGAVVEDAQWGEHLLDISTAAKRERLAAIVGDWIAGCADDGYTAVEPDNLDSWTRSDGLLTREDALDFARLLATAAHSHGLAIAQKNAAELGDAGRAAGFDFAVAEECQTNDECDAYTDVYGDDVIEIEYTDDPDGRAAFQESCAVRGDRIHILLRDRDVVPRGHEGYVSEHC
jgi:hypothetical protein